MGWKVRPDCLVEGCAWERAVGRQWCRNCDPERCVHSDSTQCRNRSAPGHHLCQVHRRIECRKKLVCHGAMRSPRSRKDYPGFSPGWAPRSRSRVGIRPRIIGLVGGLLSDHPGDGRGAKMESKNAHTPMSC